VEVVCELTRKLNAELTLLHVVAMPLVIQPEVTYDPRPFLKAGEEFLNEIRSHVEKHGGKASVHLESTYGNAAHKIVEYAKKEGFDLIALGAMGESEVKDLLLVSVAHTVARHAPCSVLIIR
jgi:nucleotide-binding universal stress UspA family protein